MATSTFTFTSNGVLFNLTLTFAGAATSGLATAISGTVGGETVTGLSNYVNGDNEIAAAFPFVNADGLSFTTNAASYNIYRNAGAPVVYSPDHGFPNSLTSNVSYAAGPGNTPPMLDHNLGSTLAEGGSDTITSADLDFNDAQQADTAITYTVTSAVNNGTLLLNGNAVGVNGTFTQDDLTNNRVTYTHNGSETTSASFGFSVSDGTATVTGQTFNFTVTPVNDAPVLAGDRAATVAEGAAVVITTADLNFTDVDDDAAGVTFTVPNLLNGSVLVNGNVATTFTGSQLAAGLVSFRHDGTETTTASFSVSIEDGNEDNSGPVASTFNLTVTPVNDAPVITLPGNLDIVVINANSGTFSVLLGDGTGGFTTVPPAGTGSLPFSVAIGDLDGDGDLDAVIANAVSNNLSVLLGDGAGGFSAAAPVQTGIQPVSVALGDLDGDGDFDAVVANSNSASVSVLLGDGAGGFTAAAPVGTGSFPSAVALADLNGDGELDAVVANVGSNTVSVLLGNGAGGFTAAAPAGTGSRPISVALGDLNGDGDIDAVTANSGNNTVSVLLGDGAGGFMAAAPVSTGSLPYSVALGDIDGDGDLDAVVANAGSSSISVLLGDGAGGFTVEANVGTGAAPQFVTLGDLDGDGDLDAVVANTGSASVGVFLGDGAGGFTAAAAIVTGSAPVAAAIGDLNLPPITAEDTAIVFSAVNGNAIRVSDADSGDITVTLTTGHGELTLAATGGLTSVSGDGTGSVTFIGAQAAIDAALDGLTYQPAANYNGPDTLQVSVNDNGNGGAPALTATRSLSLTVTAVNDAPTATGVPADVPVTSGVAADVDLSAITFADVDSGAASVTFTIAASAGSLSATDGGSVTVGGAGTGTLSLSGTAANIDTYLNTASNIQYTTAPGATGDNAATLTLTANDGGATGNGGGTDIALGTVNVDINETQALVVTTLTDVVDAFDGLTSLREAISYANAKANADANTVDTITFASNLTGTIRLDGGDGTGGVAGGTLTVSDALAIEGDGRIVITGDRDDNDTTLAGTDITDLASTNSANLTDNVRLLNATALLQLDGLALTGGRTDGFNERGGAVAGTSISITDSLVAGNITTGASAFGGAIFGNSVAVTGSTFSGNFAAQSGGGGVAAGSLEVTDSTFTGNSSFIYGGAFTASTVVATNATISANTAGEGGGGGFYAQFAEVTNSTITGNTTTGANYAGGGITIASGSFTLTNSIVLGNAAPNSDYDEIAKPNPVFTGGNIVGRNDGSGADVYSGSTVVGSTNAGDVFEQTVDIDPGIGIVLAGVVASNGGPVQTIALKSAGTNPAIDASNTAAPSTDARGVTRVDAPGIANASASLADLGAFELTILPDLIAPTVTINAVAGDNVVTAAEGAGTITVSGTAAGAEDGQTVTLALKTADGLTTLQTLTATVAAGVWSLDVPPGTTQAFPNGPYLITANVNDQAGNPAIEASQTITVDVVAPTVTINAVAGDNVVNAAEGAGTITVSGTAAGAEDGQTVTLALKTADGLTTLQTLTATVAAGVWNLDVPPGTTQAFPNGPYLITANVNDQAGNPAIEASQTITVDVVAPTVTINAVAGDNVVNAAEGAGTITVSGTAAGAEDGQTVTLALKTADGLTTLQTLTATVAAGVWSLDVPPGTTQAFPNGPYLITANVNDQAGNPAIEASQTITVDVVADIPPTVTLTTIIDTLAENTRLREDLKVANITVTAREGGIGLLSLGGTDAAFFKIVGDGLYLNAATDISSRSQLDFETRSHYDVTVIFDDGKAPSPDATSSVFTFNVTNVTDRITGSNSADVLRGSSEDAFIVGLGGNDVIRGYNGNDVIIGGRGRDIMTGGLGEDTFVFRAAIESTGGAPLNITSSFNPNATASARLRDNITDFMDGIDTIDLATIDANSHRAGNQAFKFIGGSSFTGLAGELRVQNFSSVGSTGAATFVIGDINGDKLADFVIQLNGAHSLAATDFIL